MSNVQKAQNQNYAHKSRVTEWNTSDNKLKLRLLTPKTSKKWPKPATAPLDLTLFRRLKRLIKTIQYSMLTNV